MVSKITLIEPHFSGAQFGPKTTDTSVETEPATEAASNNMKLLQGAAVFIILFVVLFALLSQVDEESAESE